MQGYEKIVQACFRYEISVSNLTIGLVCILVCVYKTESFPWYIPIMFQCTADSVTDLARVLKIPRNNSILGVYVGIVPLREVL